VETLAEEPEEAAEATVTQLNAPQARKIGILGTTPSRMQGPIGDKAWEIWTIGPGGKDVHRWDRLFEVHQIWPLSFGEIPEDGETSYLNDLSLVEPPQQVVTLQPMRTAMVDWAAEHGKDPAWLKRNIKGDWNANVVIDRERLFERLGRSWFTSSISYCIAMAIEERATDIGCWGIDLESGEEYTSQHWGAKHLLELARYIGINMHYPEGCGLQRDLNPYPDRYETHFALTTEKKTAWLEHQLGQMEPECEGLRQETYRAEGALMVMRRILAMGEEAAKTEAGLPGLMKEIQDSLPKGEQELVQLNSRLGHAAATIQHLKGELSATKYYRRMYVFGQQDPETQS
jgi:hypothetical protein